MRGKFYINADHFASKYDKVIYVYGHIKGDTLTYLTPRIYSDN
jgi:hypothetical protein